MRPGRSLGFRAVGGVVDRRSALDPREGRQETLPRSRLDREAMRTLSMGLAVRLPTYVSRSEWQMQAQKDLSLALQCAMVARLSRGQVVCGII